MAENVKALRRRLRSIRNTNKITRAMQMVSAAKLRRAQEVLNAGRPYTRELRKVLGHLSGSGTTFEHPFFEKRHHHETRTIIVVTGDRGLAGAYNMSVIKKTLALIDEAQCNVNLVCIGKKGYDFFKNRPTPVLFSATTFNGSATSADTNIIADQLAELFIKNKTDEILIVYNSFASSISYNTKCQTLLPLLPDELTDAKQDDHDRAGGLIDTYLLEPTADMVFANLMPQFLRNILYMTLVEHFTAEHSARMTAMSNACRNGEELIGKVSLVMNKARQTAITTEITEIVSGADALSS